MRVARRHRGRLALLEGDRQRARQRGREMGVERERERDREKEVRTHHHAVITNSFL